MRNKAGLAFAEAVTIYKDGTVELNGVVVWSTDCNETPEDLTWARDIGDLAYTFFRAGYIQAQLDEEKSCLPPSRRGA